MNRNLLMILLIIAGVIVVALGANRFFGVRDITPAANVGTTGATPSPDSEQTSPGTTGTINEYGEQN
jgi:hypothetical protein